MEDTIQVKVTGYEALLKKLGPGILTGPMGNFFRKSALVVQSSAQQAAPVDTGDLRASINWQVDGTSPPSWARVGIFAPEGSPLWFKARAMEFGTGRMGDPAVSHKAGHYPPGAALEVWAARHGVEGKGGRTPGQTVAWYIGKRGGLRPRPYLRPALTQNLARIRGFVVDMGREIERLWGR
jgi:hypothetical protein